MFQKKKLYFFNMGYKSLITMKPGTRPLDRINPQTGFNNYVPNPEKPPKVGFVCTLF